MSIVGRENPEMVSIHSSGVTSTGSKGALRNECWFVVLAMTLCSRTVLEAPSSGEVLLPAEGLDWRNCFGMKGCSVVLLVKLLK